MHADRALYEPLDRCIDDLLRTGTWAAPAAGPTHDELAALMQVAARLVELAGRTPPPDAGARRTIWRRLTDARTRWEAQGFPRFAALFGDAPGDARPASRQVSITSGCRPLRGVAP